MFFQLRWPYALNCACCMSVVTYCLFIVKTAALFVGFCGGGLLAFSCRLVSAVDSVAVYCYCDVQCCGFKINNSICIIECVCSVVSAF